MKLSSALRPVLYDALLTVLVPEEDLVVRLTAAQTLKIVMDDFEFTTEQYLPYLERSMQLLFTLLKDCKECDSKVTSSY